MRVYEFARNYGMTSKELVAICHEIGIEVKAQSKLDETQLATLSRHICRGKDTNETIETTPKVVKKSREAKTIAYVVTECEPFTSLGELGKTAAAFATQTIKDGRSLIIALPKYKEITEVYGTTMEWLMDLPIKVGSTEARASLFKLVQDSVTYLFIGNDRYFTREEIYGYEDDAERFAFFNRAVLEALPYLGTKISEIYVNDWHTSMIPLILNVDYKYHSFYQKVKYRRYTILDILSYECLTSFLPFDRMNDIYNRHLKLVESYLYANHSHKFLKFLFLDMEELQALHD